MKMVMTLMIKGGRRKNRMAALARTQSPAPSLPSSSSGSSGIQSCAHDKGEMVQMRIGKVDKLTMLNSSWIAADGFGCNDLLALVQCMQKIA